jgi:hypothetical protein
MAAMSIGKPFHRNYRDIKPSRQSGYSGWAYIEDREYAKNPEHYVRAFTLIQSDLRSIFEYIEPSDEVGLLTLTVYTRYLCEPV